MDNTLIQNLFIDSIKITLYLSLPVLLVGLVVGLLIAVFQATTQIQEQTLSFVPKLVAIFVVLLLISNWMGSVMIEYTMRVFDAMLQIVK